jgi:formamidopyrimidine-DNA glycosylase
LGEAHDTLKGFPNTQRDVDQFLIGATVTDVRRRAKVLLIDLSTDYTLVIHLKMTGQLVFVGHRPQSVQRPLSVPALRSRPAGEKSLKEELDRPLDTGDTTEEERFGAGHPNESLIGTLPDRSTRVTVMFADGSHLYFNDQRKFGWMKLLPTIEVPNMDFMKKVGPEPLVDTFTAADFAARFTRRAKTGIKAALLDQTVVAGVGNIYADECLWGAKLYPKRLVGTITPQEFAILYTDLREVMSLAIQKGGSTNKNYVNADGKRGSYMDFARVFRREGLPCPRCGTTIIKCRVAGRGTHICPLCQAL